MFLRIAFSLVMLLLIASPVLAQYRQYAVQHFEDTLGKWPDTLVHGHHSSPLTTRSIAWGVSEYGSLLHEGPSSAIVGNYGLELRPLESDPHLSVLDRRSLNRQKLGAEGAALFQVDFYVPADIAVHPTMAILANASDGSADRKSYRFYRFGVDRDRVYFSFTNQKGSPDIYLRQSLSEFDLTLPGWHRLQLIFRGQEEILCAIDGQITSFSPISESTLVRLEPGVMVTRAKDGGDRAVYADNLGILWTPDATDDPPGSPWFVRSSLSVPFSGLQANRWNIGGMEWTTSPSEAWREASNANKVIFAVFHGDDLAANENIIRILNVDEIKPVLTQCVPLRVDVDSGSGQVFAQRYNLTDFPAVAVIGLDGEMTNNVHVAKDSDMTWQQILEGLKGA